jgi:hypothetical protein
MMVHSGGWKQEGCEFGASLSYTVRFVLKKEGEGRRKEEEETTVCYRWEKRHMDMWSKLPNVIISRPTPGLRSSKTTSFLYMIVPRT